MKKVPALAAALLLLLVAIPAFAADCENPIAAIGAPDGKTGTALRIDWFIAGSVQSQTLSGHDLEEPVVLPATQRSFVYVPEQPGEKHMTLTVVTECGTFSRTFKYHVQQCDVAVPPITVDKTTVLRGETVTASIDPQPGHTVRWVVTGGTPSATEGESIQIVAGSFGTVRIQAFVSRGNQKANTCEGRATINVPITQPCTILEPQVGTFPMIPRPGETFTFIVFNSGPGETVSFNVTGASVLESGQGFVDVTVPATGSFTIEYTVAKTGCSRTFSRTFEVTPCAPTATVTLGAQGCDSSTVSVDFTGTAPWQGYWNDGSYFFTWEPHMERIVYAPGSYSITSFMDRDCFGTATGSAEVVTAGVPQPVYTIDPIVNGWYYDSRTCPGLVRTATLYAPIPAGHTLTWSITNGTIVSGQGTATVQFSGDAPGSTLLTATLTNAQGCSSQYTFPYVVTMGTPQASVTVEPSMIDAGQTAVVRVTRLDNYTVGMNVFSSLGDFIVPVRQVDELTTEYEYRSTNGAGVATITVEMNNGCNVVNTATTTLTINQGAPVAATATIHQFGTDCTNYGLYAQMTGTAPFSGTWSNGETFVSDYPYAYLYPNAPGTYTLTSFSDANGAGTVNGSATFDYTALPQPELTYSVPTACPNTAVTATLTTPLPEGAIPYWEVQGGTILSGQGTASIQIMPGDYVYTTVRLTGSGCSPAATWMPLPVSNTIWPLQFEVWPVNAGESTIFTAFGDPNIAEIHFENSKGDPMEIIGQYDNSYTFRYTAASGAGESIIRIWGTTACGQPFEATRTLTILPARPTATLTTAPGTCSGAVVTVTFTGTAPFTGTWMDGQTFTTNDTVYIREVTANAWYWLASFSDATGQSGGMSNQVAAQVTLQPYADSAGSTTFCPGGTGSIQVFNAVGGYEVVWSVGGIGRIVSGEGTSLLVVTADEAGTFPVTLRLRSPEGCLGPETTYTMTAQGPIAAPVITLPSTTLAPGETMDLTMEFEKWGLYTNLYWYADWPATLDFVTALDYGKYTLRFTAPAEPGQYTIHAVADTQCGQSFDVTAVVTVAAP